VGEVSITSPTRITLAPEDLYVKKMYDEDTEILDKVKRFSARKKKSFSSSINSKSLSEDEMDDLFLSY